jgi:hypothetical protein
MGHRVGLHADAFNSVFFALQHRRPRATERIQHPLTGLNREHFQVVLDQVGRIGQHKAIPVMARPIGSPHLVHPRTAQIDVSDQIVAQGQLNVIGLEGVGRLEMGH